MSTFHMPRRRHLVGALILLIGVIFSFLSVDPRTPNLTLKPWAHRISEEINLLFLVLGIGGLLFTAWRQRDRALALKTVATIGTETGLYLVAKGTTWYGFHILSRPSGTDGGFPSGHTAAAVVVAWLLAERFGAAWAPVFYVIAAGIAWSRVADGAHFAYQVLGGAILGFGVAWVLGGRFTTPAVAVVVTAPEPPLSR
ncbi:MAG: phosphatase PAP2 family protein [Akkermansiaceae bacterium]|nr:phosphatase PAP2 family protein [Armatimonadota bacterium]